MPTAAMLSAKLNLARVPLGAAMPADFTLPSVIAPEIARVLSDRIVFLELPPGTRILEEEVSANFGVSRSPIREVFRMLEADGLVRRQSDPGDRRTRLATLTAAGRKACREGVRVQRETEQSLLGKLTAAESRMLADLLAKVADR